MTCILYLLLYSPLDFLDGVTKHQLIAEKCFEVGHSSARTNAKRIRNSLQCSPDLLIAKQSTSRLSLPIAFLLRWKAKRILFSTVSKRT